MSPWEALDLATALKETRGPEYRPMPDTASPPRRLEYNGAHTSPAVLKGEALDALRDYNEWRGSYSSDIPGSPHMTHPFFSRTVPGLPTMRRDAPGWIDRVAAQGRYGDTELAHVTPAEKDLLQALGGSGTRNPTTGLPEFFDVADAAGVGMPGMGNGSMGSGGGMAGPGMGDPRGEDIAGPGGSIGAPTSPSGAATPSLGTKDALSGAALITGGPAALGMNPLGAAGGWGGMAYDALTKGAVPDIQSMPENQAISSTLSLMGLAPIDALAKGLAWGADKLGLQNMGIQSPGAGVLSGSDTGVALPESSTIASTAATAAPATTASKSILPQSPISGLDAQTYDYLKRMGIIA